MQDRVPVNPGRVLVTPENGGAAYYATLTRADNPTKEGTPPNKATLLKDATAAMYGLGSDAVPDDVLNAIKTLINGANANADAKAQIATGSYTGTGTYGIDSPNSLTFDFAPKLLIFIDNNGHIMENRSDNTSYKALLIGNPQALGTDYVSMGFPSAYDDSNDDEYYSYSKRSEDGKTLYWYINSKASYQYNNSGTVYRYVAIG